MRAKRREVVGIKLAKEAGWKRTNNLNGLRRRQRREKLQKTPSPWACLWQLKLGLELRLELKLRLELGLRLSLELRLRVRCRC
jgi:hypothetical protein